MNVQPKLRTTIDKALVGAAGVFYVASELSMRGMIALPSIRNVKGVDIIVSNPDGKHFASLQVKTSQHKVTYWPIGKIAMSWKGHNCYYVFVRRSKDHFEAFLEKAAIVAQEVAHAKRIMKKSKYEKFSPCWYITGEYAIRGAEKRTLRNWERFILEADQTYKKAANPAKA